MKKFLISALLAACSFGAQNDLKLVQEGAGGVPAQRIVPAAGPITSTATFLSQLGIAPLSGAVLTSPTITTKLSPTADDGAPLGDTTHNWSDLFLASGALINYANGNVVITHSSGILTMGTGEFRVTTAGTNTASVVTVGGTQTLTNKTLATAALGSSTATTQSAGTNNTTVATTAYADASALATILGTFASPNTAAGSVTFSTASVAITTSAAGATRTYTLPAASGYTGKKLFLTVGAGVNHVNLQPQSGAALVLSGVLLTANHYVQAATTAVGDSVVGFSDGTNWQIFVCAGTWASAASP